MDVRRLGLAAVCFILVILSGGVALAQVSPVSPEEAQAWTRYLIPLPKTVNISYKVDISPAAIAIIPPDDPDVVINQACKELRKTLGLSENASNPSNPAFTITLILGGSEAESLIPLKNSDQASKITIEPGNTGLRIVALSPPGLYYAVKSLQQLIAPYVTASNARIPLLETLDWPDMADRGLWGCDHFLWLRWMGDRKMNIGEQISARSVTSDGAGHSWLKEGRETMVNEGPYYCVKPVPAVLHLEQVSSSGLFQYYPQLRGIGGQDGCICYSKPEFVKVLADWIVELRSLPFVEEIDVWMAENLHGQGGCQCVDCSKWDRDVLEATVIVAAWQQAKQRMGVPIGLRILTSEETESSNAAVFSALPPEVKVWYYHSLYTYTSGRTGIISSDVKNIADSGRYAGVCPSISVIGCTQPFQSAEFINYRMNEFVNKNISGLIGYATPPPLVKFCGYNVEAAAEWSWNSKGRTIHEFAASYAVRKGYKDPEKFAEWADAIGKLEFDLYGSDWPTCEGRYFPGYVADCLRRGRLPALGEAYPGFRGPWGEFKSAQQLDDDVALAAKAVCLAKEMGINEYWYESLHADGYINALRALYKLKGLVVNGTVSAANREVARYYFGVYINSLKQSIDAVQKWSVAVNGESGSVQTVVGILQRCIDGEAGTANPGMLQVAIDCGCTPTLTYSSEPAVSIAEAKLRGAGATVRLYGDMVTGGFGNTRYLQERDRSLAIRVRTSAAVTTSTPAVVSGYIENLNGELTLNADVTQSSGPIEPVAPVSISMRNIAGGAFGGQPAVMEYRLVKENQRWVRKLVPALGLNNLGLFVKVGGRVTYVGSDYFYVDDGNRCDDDSGYYGIKVLCADATWNKPSVGQYVTVKGMCSSYFERGLTWRALYLPSSSNIVSYPAPLEIILDESSARFTGEWSYHTITGGAYANDYKKTASSGTETATARWQPGIPITGNYDVYVMYYEDAGNTAKAPYTIFYNGGMQTVEVNQTTGGGTWHLLGTRSFAAGSTGYIQLGNGTSESGKAVVADAVKFVYAGEEGSAPPGITGQPSDQPVCPGETAVFTVSASGSGMLSYQWRKGTANITDGGHYSGSTTPTLIVSNCDSSDASPDYNCVVSSAYGSATSNNAALTVGATPAAPGALPASDIGTDTITWNWGSVAGAGSYKLWTAASGGTQVGGTITGGSYTETGLDPNASYTRYVEAVSSCATSATRTQLGPVVTTVRNCLENSDFEGGFNGVIGAHWMKGSGSGTFARETTIKRDGTSSQKLVDVVGGDAFTAFIYQKINVQPGRGYSLKIYHRREVATGAVCKIGVNFTGGLTPDQTSDSNGAAGEWRLKTINFTSGATGTITAMFAAGYNGGNGTVYVDGVYVLPQAPTSTGGSTTIANGSSTNITASGGFNGSSSELHWYTGPGGTGVHVGTGTTLSVSPTATTTYYPRWEAVSGCGCCISDDGAPVTVTVSP